MVVGEDDVTKHIFLRTMYSKEQAAFFDQRAKRIAEELILAK
jgi:hypothetical protein